MRADCISGDFGGSGTPHDNDTEKFFAIIVMRGPGAPHDNDTETLSPIIVVGFGGAKSHRVIGLFFFKETYNTVGFGRSPRAVSPKRTMDLDPTDRWRPLATLSDDATSRSDPTSHARIPRMTVVATQLPQITSSLLQYCTVLYTNMQ